ncbi:hypothetical protein V6N13_029921 [Hibiscus sabdariffa]
MQSLGPLRPQGTMLLKRPWVIKPLNLRALSSIPPSEYSNQSRGGLPRFFSETLPSSKGGAIRVQGDEFWHMTKVLRLKIDDRVELFNGRGGLVEGFLQNIDRTAIDFVALEDPKFVLPQTPQWHIFAAFGSLKGGRADWLVEKCTELGASSVTPLLTERSFTFSDNRVERLQRVILAAAKQCQRLHEMKLNHPVKINELIPLVAKSKQSFIAIAEATPLVSALTSTTKEPSGLIIVGPEGDSLSYKMIKVMVEITLAPIIEGLCFLVSLGSVEPINMTCDSGASDFTEKEVNLITEAANHQFLSTHADTTDAQGYQSSLCQCGSTHEIIVYFLVEVKDEEHLIPFC